MSSQVYEFNVAMTCSGCSTAVNRVLGKLQNSGVEKVDIDLEAKKVFVTSTLSAEDLLTTLQKTGKEVSYVGIKA